MVGHEPAVTRSTNGTGTSRVLPITVVIPSRPSSSALAARGSSRNSHSNAALFHAAPRAARTLKAAIVSFRWVTGATHRPATVRATFALRSPQDYQRCIQCRVIVVVHVAVLWRDSRIDNSNRQIVVDVRVDARQSKLNPRDCCLASPWLDGREQDSSVRDYHVALQSQGHAQRRESPGRVRRLEAIV